jgi:hypothetical protein
MIVGTRRTRNDDVVALAGNGLDRASRLKAATAALDPIAREVGSGAAVVLLSDALETAAARLRGEIGLPWELPDSRGRSRYSGDYCGDPGYHNS